MLSYLTHVVGDLHQPLHSCTLVNEDFPHGDRGGNSFLVTVYTKDKEISELHALWDSVLTKAPNDAPTPLNSADYNTLIEYATSYMKEFPEESLSELTDNLTVESWADESWTACRDVVYKGISMNDVLQEDYLAKGYQVAKKRIVLAGLRLSKMLQHIFELYSNKVDPPKPSESLEFLK